jgi:DNA-binding CsgD family transcriptional regulator
VGGGIATRVLDQLDLAVLVFSSDLSEVVLANQAARAKLGDPPPPLVREACRTFASSRRDQQRMPPPMRITVGEAAFYLRVLESPGEPPLEIALLHEEVLREGAAFTLLNSRFGLTRREFQVLNAIRLGKTDRQIAAELGLAAGTVHVHVHNLLSRFSVPNRTRLVDVVERFLQRGG